MNRRDRKQAKKRRERQLLAAFLLMAVLAIAIGVAAAREIPRMGVSAQPSPGGPRLTLSTGTTTTTMAGASSSATQSGESVSPSSSTSAYRPELSSTTAAPSTTTTVRTHAIGDPVRIVIPAIDVDAEVIHVGLLADGTLEVPPFGLAAWYELGPAPGASGPAVIVAHVDSKRGPDVFYHLKELEPGDEVVVYDSNGDSATFAVDSKEQQLKVDLPIGRIWNDTWEPVIRLITCGGKFDHSTGHYLSNVIVYGHLVK